MWEGLAEANITGGHAGTNHEQPLIEVSEMEALSNSLWISADSLIEKMKASGDQEYDLMVEHLETAHAYCLGAMGVECTHNLQLAQRASERLSGKPLQHELQQAITTLLHDLPP